MRVLVYPQELRIGGSQINAIDLAAAVGDLGHEVVLFAPPGPLEGYVHDRGLRLIRAPKTALRGPSPRAMAHLWRTVGKERVDLVHAYEHDPCVEAFLAAHLVRRLPMVGTVLSMSVSRTVPKAIPLIVGTREILEQARRAGHRSVALMEPPIDTERDHPSVDGSAFRRRHGLDGAPRIVVMVTRMDVGRSAEAVKIDSIERIVDAVALLAGEAAVRLIVVGGGDAFPEVQRRAAAANERAGREAVVLIGPLLDPRPAYAVADIVVGMGSSILRGMAFEKPAIVVGANGFSEVFTPERAARFLEHGFYGIGDGADHRLLYGQLKQLLSDEAGMDALGRYGRRLVCERFSLSAAARSLESIYADAVTHRPRARDLVPEAWFVSTRVTRQAIRRRRAQPAAPEYSVHA